MRASFILVEGPHEALKFVFKGRNVILGNYLFYSYSTERPRFVYSSASLVSVVCLNVPNFSKKRFYLYFFSYCIAFVHSP